ncbi:MAG: thiol peroxidase [Bacteroidota bacterium]
MATITLQGNEIHTSGNLPEKGTKAPDFKLTNTELGTKTLSDFEGHNLVLNIFPSVDTGVCATSIREFNKKASELENTKVLCISKDLPFAQSRFCGAEGLDNVIPLSDFKDGNFGKAYGVDITDGAFEGLLSRAVVVIDKSGEVLYNQQVSEIADEPNYEAALGVLN